MKIEEEKIPKTQGTEMSEYHKCELRIPSKLIQDLILEYFSIPIEQDEKKTNLLRNVPKVFNREDYQIIKFQKSYFELQEFSELLKVICYRTLYAFSHTHFKFPQLLFLFEIYDKCQNLNNASAQEYFKIQYIYNYSRGFLDSKETAMNAYNGIIEIDQDKEYIYSTQKQNDLYSWIKNVLNNLMGDVFKTRAYKEALKHFLIDSQLANLEQVQSKSSDVLGQLKGKFYIELVNCEGILGMTSGNWKIYLSTSALMKNMHLLQNETVPQQDASRIARLQWDNKNTVDQSEPSEMQSTTSPQIKIPQQIFEEFKPLYLNFLIIEKKGKITSLSSYTDNEIMGKIYSMLGLGLWACIHECAHDIARYMLNSQYRLSPRGTDPKIGKYEAGYRFSAILLGNSCLSNWQYNFNNDIPQILRVAQWGDKKIPVFKQGISQQKYSQFGNFNLNLSGICALLLTKVANIL